MNYALHLLIYFTIYATVATSLNIVVGYCGLLSLAHAAYFAIGSYVYALVTLKCGWGFLPAIGIAVMIAAGLSLAISLPSWRFKGDYFVLVSLAVQVMFFSVMQNWWSLDAPAGTWANLTNGASGLSVPITRTFGMRLDSLGRILVVGVLLLGACSLVSRVLLASPFGRLLQCLRDDELAMRGLGKNVRLARVQALAIACGMVAAAGALYAAHVRYVDPHVALLDESILMLSMVVIGGAGNFRGPLVGAGALILIEEILRFIPLANNRGGLTARVIGGSDVAAAARLMVYGMLLVVMMHFRPQGLAGRYRIE